MTVTNDDLILFSAAVARDLLGEPDSSDAGHLRFGAISVNVQKASFYDNEADEGGLLIDLVRRFQKKTGDIEEWLDGVRKKETKRRADMAMNRDLPEIDTDLRNISLERELLGAMILKPTIIDLIAEDLVSGDLAFPFHRDVYMAIADMVQRGEPPTLPKLIVELGGDDGAEIVPGFTVTTYLTRVTVDAPTKYEDKARETALKLRELADERQNPPDLDGPVVSKFGALRWEDLDAPGPEHEWTVDDILSRCDRSIVAGPSKSGKSFLAIHLGMAVARGVPFFGHKTRHGGVIYQAGEGARGVKKRLRAYRNHFGVPKKLGTFVLLTKQVDLYRPTGDTSDLIQEIKAWAESMPVPLELIVIDTLATATAGADENSVKDMSTVLANIARIAHECQAHVMLVHHMNAGGTKLRGSTSIYSNVDQVVEVLNDAETKIKTATLSKQKDDEDGLRFRFRLKKIVLDARPDGKENSSCVVMGLDETEQAQAAADKRSFRTNPGEHAFYKALVTALGEHGEKPPEGCAAPRGIGLVVHYDRVKEIFKKQNLSEESDQDKENERLKKTLQRARTSLARFNCIGADNPWIWRTTRLVGGFPPLGSSVVSQYDAGNPPPVAGEDEFHWR